MYIHPHIRMHFVRYFHVNKNFKRTRVLFCFEFEFCTFSSEDERVAAFMFR